MPPIDLRKKGAWALLSIVLFIVSYLLLLALAVALAAVCAYAGIWIMAARISIWTVLFGLGFIGLGLLVLFFLVKFLFHQTKTDRSGMVEITAKEEPRLVALVYQLADDVKTDKPKRIYLTSDINAAVFYDSSFWSMFFPVRKNLQIGIGLVNSVTESELKAILAHEFGHFSQSSMKVGSYVYQVNRIIYNMLYENDSFQSLIVQFANISNVFALFVSIGIKIVEVVQWILKKLYAVVNLSYLQLSREMEFHADEVAASIAGSQPLIESLMRMEFAETAYQDVLNFYGRQIEHNKKTSNVYPNHRIVMKISAQHFKLEERHGLARITPDKIKQFNRSRLVIKDQWASHPTTEERVQRLEQLNVPAALSDASAWILFENPGKWQTLFTEKMFQSVSYNGNPDSLSPELFEQLFLEEQNKYNADKHYAGIYDRKDIGIFNLEEVLKQSDRYAKFSLKELFSEDCMDLLYLQSGLNNDIQLLESLKTEKHDIKSFDFDGKKYKIKQLGTLLDALKKEKQELDEQITDIDRQSFLFFYIAANTEEHKEQLKQMYRDYFSSYQRFQEDILIYQNMMQVTHFMQFTMSYDDIRNHLVPVYDLEKKLKEALRQLLLDNKLSEVLDETSRHKLQEYLAKDYLYFKEPAYNEHALGLLFNANQALQIILTENLQQKKKEILSYQMGLVTT